MMPEMNRWHLLDCFFCESFSVEHNSVVIFFVYSMYIFTYAGYHRFYYVVLVSNVWGL